MSCAVVFSEQWWTCFLCQHGLDIVAVAEIKHLTLPRLNSFLHDQSSQLFPFLWFSGYLLQWHPLYSTLLSCQRPILWSCSFLIPDGRLRNRQQYLQRGSYGVFCFQCLCAILDLHLQYLYFSVYYGSLQSYCPVDHCATAPFQIQRWVSTCGRRT